MSYIAGSKVKSELSTGGSQYDYCYGDNRTSIKCKWLNKPLYQYRVNRVARYGASLRSIQSKREPCLFIKSIVV